MKLVAIIGNTNWQSRRKIQEILFNLKSQFNDDITIVGAGGEGANNMVRKAVLEFGMQYEEYNPSFSGRNMYSAMPDSYYGKPYHFSQLHHRMKLIAHRCDHMLILTNEDTLDPVLKTAYNNINKLKKPVVILG